MASKPKRQNTNTKFSLIIKLPNRPVATPTTELRPKAEDPDSFIWVQALMAIKI